MKREFSSAGSEHLPYKQRVGGSNPSTPTTISYLMIQVAFFVSMSFVNGETLFFVLSLAIGIDSFVIARAYLISLSTSARVVW